MRPCWSIETACATSVFVPPPALTVTIPSPEKLGSGEPLGRKRATAMSLVSAPAGSTFPASTIRPLRVDRDALAAAVVDVEHEPAVAAEGVVEVTLGCEGP